jgi:hypothetical protein
VKHQRRTSAPFWLLAVALGVGIVAFAPVRAQAADSDWAGSTWTNGLADDSVLTAEAPVLSGSFRYARPLGFPAHIADIYINLVPSTPLPEGCAAPTELKIPSTNNGNANPAFGTFSTPVSVDCNGTYDITALAEARMPKPTEGVVSSYTLRLKNVQIARPADVSNVKATVNSDRTVTVTWVPGLKSPYPSDFTGYEITRSPTFSKAGAAGPSARSFKDTSVPEGGGSFTYTVKSNRGSVTAQSSSAATVVPPPTADTLPDTAPTPGGTPGTGGTGGPPGTGVAGVVVPGAGATNNPFARITPRQISPTQPRAGAPDEGFNTDLPYEAEPGDVAAQLPGDVQTGNSDLAGAGVLVPFSVALLLAVWAMHILYVTKQAREVDEALAVLQVEFE